ncbi:MAG: MmcQ-like protein [Bacteroidetes bacterium 4572_77]|nr:MAG: MmcQ-like protein [Bacteroidetes bacterium 4572_77]
MNIEDIRDYCIAKAAVSEGFPFDEVTLILKVHQKMFALISLNGPLRVNLKCEPERATALREQYTEIIPGYHMNKKHWNTVSLEGDLPIDLIKSLIDDSYNLVFNSLPKRLRES